MSVPVNVWTLRRWYGELGADLELIGIYATEAGATQARDAMVTLRAKQYRESALDYEITPFEVQP